MTAGCVLICYDGSPEAGRAFGVAARLLAAQRAVVLAVAQALTTPQHLAASMAVVSTSTFAAHNGAAALECAREGATRARVAGFEAEARSEVAGTRLEGVLAVAEELDPAAIVVGSRGLSGLRELARGSLSHAVAEHSRHPVLIVPPLGGDTPRAGDGPAVVCYDGSRVARHAVATAAEVLRGREAVVLEVASFLVDPAYPDIALVAPQVDETRVRDAVHVAEAGARNARLAGFEATARVGSGTTVAEAVSGVAADVDASVVVIGSRGGDRMIAGESLSHEVATHGGRPVLVVPFRS